MILNAFSLEGKVAVVTGCDTGYTDADFFALHFCDRQNVNRLQKRG